MSTIHLVNRGQYMKGRKPPACPVSYTDITQTPHTSISLIKQNLSNDSIFRQKVSNKSEEKVTELDIEISDKYLKFYKTSILGMRQTNEDSHISFNYKQYSVAALFDGHNGKEVAQHASKLLKNTFIKQLESGWRMEYVLQDTVDYINTVIINNDQFEQQGSTSLIVVVDTEEEIIHVSVVGDSRAIIGYGKNPRQPVEEKLFKETKDHSVENDKQRLLDAGAHIVDVEGVLRVNGVLAVARSIGDHYLKQYVTCKQDYYEFPLKYCEYILLTCDGLTDVFTSEDIDKMIRQVQNNEFMDQELKNQMDGKLDQNTHLIFDNVINSPCAYGKHHCVTLFENVNPKAPIAQQTTQALTKLAYFGGSTDNVSVMLAFLKS